MSYRKFPSNHFRTLIAAVLSITATASFAAPNVLRLTPPSELFSTGNAAPIIARFLPEQRFDLQATVKADAGTSITGVQFLVDNVAVTAPLINTSIAAADALPAGSNGYAVSLRAYSNAIPGIHTLTVRATQSDGQIATATGNFEVIGTTAQGRPAKNIIFLLGDGMGAAHRTAARIMVKGYAQGKAKAQLAMDTFPYTGMVMTASLNSIVTDSAPGMANYVNGNKANNNQEGVFPDDTRDAFDNPRVEYISEFLARTRGKSLGIVTTADVFDATPAANAVHTSNRGNGTGIVDQYLDDRHLTGLTVLMGGGRKWFIPKNSAVPPANSANIGNGSVRATASDYILPSDIVAGWGASQGALDPNRDLIADFQSAGFAYASDRTTLQSMSTPAKLLGLFSYSNMNVAFDKINGRRGSSTIVNDYGFPDQPMLDEMTSKALQVLSQNPNGFFLMVEGASIDKQAHLMDSDRWIVETIEFDRAIDVAKHYAQLNPDTLVIVTADHECSGAAIIGASLGTGANAANVGTYDNARFPAYIINADGYPATTDVPGKILIGYAANADRYETWMSNPKPTQDSQQPFSGQAPLNTYPANANVRNISTGYLITGQITGDQAAHTATDIPLSAFGRAASLFTGVFDNTDVFFKMGQAVIGGAR